MSITISTDVFCDICSIWNQDLTQFSTKKAQIKRVRKTAKYAGWKKVRISGQTFDLCPNCKHKEYRAILIHTYDLEVSIK
jgi:predicted DsbA family dithiol-disulfide isomerase